VDFDKMEKNVKKGLENAFFGGQKNRKSVFTKIIYSKQYCIEKEGQSKNG
jgi:hypothetical protein